MTSASFWAGFWPNFAATMIAAVFGIPVGLWINRRAERSASKARSKEQELIAQQEAAEERTRTREALGQLVPVIQSHTRWFKTLGAWGSLNEFHDGPLAELWTVLRGQVVPSLLTDRRLFGDLANHFERCVRIEELLLLRSSLAQTGVPAQHERILIETKAIATRLNNMRGGPPGDPDALAGRGAREIGLLNQP